MTVIAFIYIMYVLKYYICVVYYTYTICEYPFIDISV